jgi:hypothetical protein
LLSAINNPPITNSKLIICFMYRGCNVIVSLFIKRIH